MSIVRHPRTASEARRAPRRGNLHLDDGVVVKVRPARSAGLLPHEWDDRPAGRRGRSWKNYRLNQWRAVQA